MKNFEFIISIQRKDILVKIKKWEIIDKKSYGRKVKICGYGNDGMLYDATANITQKEEVKSIKVNIDSRRWQ